MKLTDTQLVLLSGASQREDRGVEVGSNLKGGAAHKVLGRLLTEGLVEELPAHGALPVWRRDEENRPLALCITKHGLDAIQVDESGSRPEAGEASGPEPGANLAGNKPSRRAPARRKSKAADKAPKPRVSRNRSDSKQARVIEMLRRQQGATVAAIMKATGWQPHSVRGFLAGVVRSKLGLALVSEKSDGERVYRIAGGKPATRSKGRSGRKAA
jgi:Protein of unknown function (DUF3489)